MTGKPKDGGHHLHREPLPSRLTTIERQICAIESKFDAFLDMYLVDRQQMTGGISPAVSSINIDGMSKSNQSRVLPLSSGRYHATNANTMDDSGRGYKGALKCACLQQLRRYYDRRRRSERREPKVNVLEMCCRNRHHHYRVRARSPLQRRRNHLPLNMIVTIAIRCECVESVLNSFETNKCISVKRRGGTIKSGYVRR